MLLYDTSSQSLASNYSNKIMGEGGAGAGRKSKGGKSSLDRFRIFQFELVQNWLNLHGNQYLAAFASARYMIW
jgi:hypothetical protein